MDIFSSAHCYITATKLEFNAPKTKQRIWGIAAAILQGKDAMFQTIFQLLQT